VKTNTFSPELLDKRNWNLGPGKLTCNAHPVLLKELRQVAATRTERRLTVQVHSRTLGRLSLPMRWNFPRADFSAESHIRLEARAGTPLKW